MQHVSTFITGTHYQVHVPLPRFEIRFSPAGPGLMEVQVWTFDLVPEPPEFSIMRGEDAD